MVSLGINNIAAQYCSGKTWTYQVRILDQLKKKQTKVCNIKYLKDYALTL